MRCGSKLVLSDAAVYNKPIILYIYSSRLGRRPALLPGSSRAVFARGPVLSRSAVVVSAVSVTGQPWNYRGTGNSRGTPTRRGRRPTGPDFVPSSRAPGSRVETADRSKTGPRTTTEGLEARDPRSDPRDPPLPGRVDRRRFVCTARPLGRRLVRVPRAARGSLPVMPSTRRSREPRSRLRRSPDRPPRGAPWRARCTAGSGQAPFVVFV